VRTAEMVLHPLGDEGRECAFQGERTLPEFEIRQSVNVPGGPDCPRGDFGVSIWCRAGVRQASVFSSTTPFRSAEPAVVISLCGLNDEKSGARSPVRAHSRVSAS